MIRLPRLARLARLISLIRCKCRIACGLTLLALQAGVLSPQTSSPPQSAPDAPGNRAIAGAVLNVKTGRPILDADVTLTQIKSRTLLAETRTDAQGRFLFAHLQDGKYSLRASHRGYIAAAFDQHEGYSTAIVTGEGLITTGLRFTLSPQAVIYGTITEDSGDPVPQARVSLYRQDLRSGTEKMVRAETVNTDGMGNYEFPRLAPGSYYLAVTASPWYAMHQMTGAQVGGAEARPRSPLDAAYATTYFPDATDSGSATPIPVTAGDRIQANFSLHPVPALHITMPIQRSGDNGSFNTPQFHQDIFGITDPVQGAISYSIHSGGPDGNSENTVEISGLAPGHYEVELQPSGGETSVATTIDATSDRDSIDFSSALPLADVSGKIRFANLPANQSPSTSTDPKKDVTILLRPRQGVDARGVRVETDGSFESQALRPGVYEVQAFAGGTPLALTHLAARGASVNGHLLTVGSEPITLTVTVGENSATVNGFAKHNGSPAPGVLILLIPANPVGGDESPRVDQSNSDGSFTMARVPAGEYTVVAIEDGWTLDWARPEATARYLSGGLKVTIPPHSKDINLSDFVEVQPR
jgi:5-hydroxyisourate hydrolase-like protein (transthyretin family)